MSDSFVNQFALIGAPNSGKTTLFNWITGSRFRTVNYPGSTVEYSVGDTLPQYVGRKFKVMDTPGTYSLSPKSPDEEVTWRTLFKPPPEIKSQAVIAVVDATQMSRHLLVVDQLKETGFPIIVAVTMTDLLEKQGYELDPKKLEEEWGVPFVLIDGRLGGGVKELVERASRMIATDRDVRTPRRLSASELESHAKDIHQRVAKVLKSSFRKKGRDPAELTRKLDRILLNPFGGLFIFFAVMTALFTAIFWVASPIMSWIDDTVGNLVAKILSFAPESLLVQFLSEGVIASFGSILVFAPQIFILFMGLTLLEDSGYLARAATLIDRPLSKIGLNGRAFTAILSGYACAIPAMMASRTISNRKERLLTIFILPLMSCSARLPVYALLLSFLFMGQPSWVAGLTLTGIYFLSLLIGAATAVVAGRFFPADAKSFFILELPLYRAPHTRTMLRHAFSKTKSFITRAGPIIFVIATVLWAATTFPNYNLKDKTDRVSQSYAASLGHALEPVMKPMGADWRVGVGLISAFVAREVFVSSMAIMFHVSEDSDEALKNSLLSAMQGATTSEGKPLFTTASVIGLIVFFIIALQCAATFSISVRESGSLKFALAQLTTFNLGAYFLAVAIVQSLHHLGIP